MDTFYGDVGGVEGPRPTRASFYRRVLADPVLAPVFASFTPTHVDHVAVWLAEVFGGAQGVTARLGGGHGPVGKAHGPWRRRSAHAPCAPSPATSTGGAGWSSWASPSTRCCQRCLCSSPMPRPRWLSS